MTAKQVGETLSYLDTCGPIASLCFLLRMDPSVARELWAKPAGDWWIEELIRQSFQPRLEEVRRLWRDCIGTTSGWGGMLDFPSIHACIVRGPVHALRTFVVSIAMRGDKSPLSAIIRNIPIAPPEQTIPWDLLEGRDPGVIERLDELKRKFAEADAQGKQSLADKALELLQDRQVVAALDLFERLVSRLPWFGPHYDVTNLRRALNALRKSGSNINNLGVGNLTRFGDDAGRDQKIILIDSGADEFSPWLQGQIIEYARVDVNGQFKKAHDCMDNACHGTKMATLIAGRPCLPGELGLTNALTERLLQAKIGDFGLSDDRPIRVGVAPGARLGVISALAGELFNETGETHQLVAALGCAASWATSGYTIVNISIEMNAGLLDDDTRVGLDGIFTIMQKQRLLPIIAAGNHGQHGAPLSQNAWKVGVADASHPSGPGQGGVAQLWAPGIDIPCGQPKYAKLGNILVNAHSGSSIATAIVSGCVAVLCGQYSELTASQAINLLADSDKGEGISLDRARELLGKA